MQIGTIGHSTDRQASPAILFFDHSTSNPTQLNTGFDNLKGTAL